MLRSRRMRDRGDRGDGGDGGHGISTEARRPRRRHGVTRTAAMAWSRRRRKPASFMSRYARRDHPDPSSPSIVSVSSPPLRVSVLIPCPPSLRALNARATVLDVRGFPSLGAGVRWLGSGLAFLAAYAVAGMLLGPYPLARSIFGNTSLILTAALVPLIVLRRRRQWAGCQRLFWDVFALSMLMWIVGHFGW